MKSKTLESITALAPLYFLSLTPINFHFFHCHPFPKLSSTLQGKKKKSTMLHLSGNPHFIYTCLMLLAWVSQSVSLSTGFELNQSLTYIWPLPHELSSGNETLTVNPTLSLSLIGKGGNFKILREGFRRYKRIIFKQSSGVSIFKNLRRIRSIYDISQMRIIVNSDSDEVKLGTSLSLSLSF